MTEKEKMIKGELYAAGDVMLVTERTACKELCYYNALSDGSVVVCVNSATAESKNYLFHFRPV